MNTPQDSPTDDQIHDTYLYKINALIAADREHLIADITAEYASTIGRQSGVDRYQAA